MTGPDRTVRRGVPQPHINYLAGSMPKTAKSKNSNQNRAENMMSDPIVNCTKHKRTIFSSKFHNNVKSHIQFDEGVANIISLQNRKSLPHRPKVNSQFNHNQNTSSMLSSGDIFHHPPGITTEHKFYNAGSSKKKNLLIRNHSAIHRDRSDLADKKFKTSDLTDKKFKTHDTSTIFYKGCGALSKSSNDHRLINSAIMTSRMSASETEAHRWPKQNAEKRAANGLKKNDIINTIISLKDSQFIITM
jgi:hypothetical protein